MTQYDLRTGLEVLDRAACEELLASTPVGRLVTTASGRPEVYCMNHLFADGAVLMRSGPGSKLDALGQPVAYEVDSLAEQFRLGWSVTVHGVLEEITDPVLIARCEGLGLEGWTRPGKRHWLRVVPHDVEGRRVGRGDETMD